MNLVVQRALLVIACLAVSLRAAVIDRHAELHRWDFSLAAPPSAIASDGSNILFAMNAPLGAQAMLLTTNGLHPRALSVNESGLAPRVEFSNGSYLLVWVNGSQLRGCLVAPTGVRITSNFTISPGTNVSDFAISSGDGGFLVVWRNGETNTANQIRARVIDASTGPVGADFQVSESSAVLHPAVASDGTNFLVVWQTQTNSEWQIVGRLIGAAGEFASSVFPISATNAAVPYPLAVAFGRSNYLVAWMRSKTVTIERSLHPADARTELSYATVFARILSRTGQAVTPELPLTGIWSSPPPTVIFNGDEFLVMWDEWTGSLDSYLAGEIPSSQRVAQTIREDGTRDDYNAALRTTERSVRLCRAGPFICAASANQIGTMQLFGSWSLPDPRFKSLTIFPNGVFRAELANGGTALTDHVWAALQRSTNLIDWESVSGADGGWLDASSSTSHQWRAAPTLPRQFFRLHTESRFQCIKSLRAIEWAKQQWAFEQRKSGFDGPTNFDLYGAEGYVPQPPKCPAGGAYSIGLVGEKATCSIAGHTL